MTLKVWEYEKCSTCRKALAFLSKAGVAYERLAIVESPPSPGELEAMLAHQGGELRRLFNTSGLLYREMGLGAKLKTMPPREAVALLSRHGKLVKRPFALGKGFGLLGFDEKEWRRKLA